MSNRIVILNGADSTDERFGTALSLLISMLEQEQADVRCFHLKDIHLAHCTGCFGCWVKTPGQCVTADQGREIVRTIVNSDTLILFTPVTFGGYSSTLKLMVDRFIPLVSPFFILRHGEIHHLPRYQRYPRLIGIGLAEKKIPGADKIFQTLAGRNAVNMLSPSFAAGVVDTNTDQDNMKRQLQELIVRSDPWPPKDLLDFFPKPDDGLTDCSDTKGRALLVVGSPKINQRSTSAILGEYVLEKMADAGWETDALTLKADLNRDSGQQKLLAAAGRADLIILAFPLYVDALPFLVTKALEVLADQRANDPDSPGASPRRLFVIINNGFPEYEQNALALAICRAFADQCGFTWAGALALGAGEAQGAETELHLKSRMGLARGHIRRALDAAGASLAGNRPVLFSVQEQIGKTPLLLMPFGLWRRMFIWVGALWWLKKAAKNGLKKRDLDAGPYAE